MAYTTLERIRREAGFERNDYIHDDTIRDAMEQAEAYVKSFISSRYVLADLSRNFTGSQAEDVLRRLTTQLAAAYLLQKEYGAEAQDTDKDGYKKEEQAMNRLADLSNGTLRLIDANGTEYTLYGSSSHGSISSTTPSLDESPRKASVNMKW